MSVQVHAELVQLLAGNAVVAKTPSQGGFHTLTLAHALMRRADLPVTLLSGVGRIWARPSSAATGIGALAFVGGRANGRRAAVSLADTGRRHMLEQEGLNTWGIWDFSQWHLLAQHLRKGFEYAKQRCTAYPRYVVQRRLFPAFLETYLPVVKSIRFGHPLAVDAPTTRFPTSTSVRSSTPPRRPTWAAQWDEAIRGGGIPLYRGSVGDGLFLDAQDTSAYVAPGLRPATAGRVVAPPRRAVRPHRLGGHRGHRIRTARRHERQQRLAGRQHRHRRPGLRRPGGRAAAVVQGRHQQAPQPGRPRGGLRRPRRTPGRGPSSAAISWSRR